MSKKVTGLYKPVVFRTGKSGERIRSESSVYWGRLRDPATGKQVRKSLQTRDSRVAIQRLRDWERELTDAKAGRIDRYAVELARPLAEHLADWDAHFAAAGVIQNHRRVTIASVRRFLDECGMSRWADLDPAALSLAIGRASGAPETKRRHVRNLRQFARWLVKQGRAPHRPLESMSGPRSVPVRERRALDADEARWLLDVTQTAPGWRESLSGADRARLYMVALGTGFRRAELAGLHVADFVLDDPAGPFIRLDAARTKTREAVNQPIRDDLAAVLRPWLAGRKPGELVFPGNWPDRAAPMLRADLRRARARWIRATPERDERRRRRESDFLRSTDASGRRLDFHALRVSFATALCRGGASVRSAQLLMRHKTVALTIGLYSKLNVTDLRADLDGLPGLATPTQRTRSRTA